MRIEQFFRFLGYIKNCDLLVHGNRLHYLINHFPTLQFCTHDIDLRSIYGTDFQKSHPVAMASFLSFRKLNLIVKSETVPYLDNKNKTLKNQFSTKRTGLQSPQIFGLAQDFSFFGSRPQVFPRKSSLESRHSKSRHLEKSHFKKHHSRKLKI